MLFYVSQSDQILLWGTMRVISLSLKVVEEQVIRLLLSKGGLSVASIMTIVVVVIIIIAGIISTILLILNYYREFIFYRRTKHAPV